MTVITLSNYSSSGSFCHFQKNKKFLEIKYIAPIYRYKNIFRYEVNFKKNKQTPFTKSCTTYTIIITRSKQKLISLCVGAISTFSLNVPKSNNGSNNYYCYRINTRWPHQGCSEIVDLCIPLLISRVLSHKNTHTT